MSSGDEINMKKSIFRIMLSALLIFSVSGFASAQSWTESFDRICASADVADTLSTERLKELVVESDELLKVIESGSDPRKKVYLFRLKKCRNFFAYIVELRKAEEKP